ncbi:DUF4214 domain-containing protein [Ferrovum myxofaciens]|uniref:DUF4214 domain-containing protein n=1 Tax=Ferrovum myxofaciens TaxID=416213 RepID=UPI000689D4B0|nr:DUF4214 domain-containing protein [Ferrovum myxofaciens]
MALTANQVQQAYLAYFGRPADVIGLNYWEGQSQAAMTAGFAASAEFANMYAGMSAAAEVNQVYQNVLGRQADPAGLTYWGVQLTSGAQTIGSLVNAIYQAVLSEPATSTDNVTVTNRLNYATAFTSAMTNSTPDIVGYSGTAAASAARAAITSAVPSGSTVMTTFSTVAADVTSVVGAGVQGQTTTFNLTTGVDTLSGGPNATFIADNTGNTKTLGVADTISGSGTGNTLKVYLAAGEITIGGTAGNITGVQNLYVNKAGDSAGSALSQDFSTYSFTSITVDGEAKAADTLTLKGQALTLENTGYGATITDTTDTSLTVTVSAMSAGTLDTSAASKATVLNLVSSGTITGGNVVTLSTNAIDTALNVSGATAITVTAGSTGSADLTSITDTGTGGNTFDISGGTVNAGFTFTGGSGGDTLILKAGDLTTLTSGSQLNGGGLLRHPQPWKSTTHHFLLRHTRL